MIRDGFLETIPGQIEVDLCIIGAGAAGLSIAHELAVTSTKIAIIDSGGLNPLSEPQSLNQVESTKQIVPLHSRVRQFGGSTTAWSGKWVCMTRNDFAEKPWLSGSGWPIKPEVMENYYDRASTMHKGPALSDYMHWFETRKDQAAAELLPASVYWLGKTNLDFGLTIGQQIQDAGNISTYLGTTVTEIGLTNNGKAVSHLNAVTAKGDTTKLYAQSFVIACGGIENARLMLASNSQNAAGVGNANNLVGRFYMDHPSGNAAFVILNDGVKLSDVIGKDVQSNGRDRMDIGMYVPPKLRESEKLLNSYFVWRSMNDVEPSLEIRKLFSTLMHIRSRPKRFILYRDVLVDIWNVQKLLALRYLWFLLLRKLGWSSLQKKYRINYHIEMAPHADNRVTLSKDVDINGYPLAKVSWQASQRELESVSRLHEELATLLKSKKAGRLVWNAGSEVNASDFPYRSASHHMGTTRMGSDPATSVVDGDCRVHGIDNLYIAGSSVFPTGGFANPTLTIVALAIRLADTIKAKLK